MFRAILHNMRDPILFVHNTIAAEMLQSADYVAGIKAYIIRLLVVFFNKHFSVVTEYLFRDDP